MHNSIENVGQLSTLNISTECQTDTCVQEVDSPGESYRGPNRCIWQQPHWQNYLPPTPDSYLWSPTSPQQATCNIGLKPMVASAPVTPEIIPYHGKYSRNLPA